MCFSFGRRRVGAELRPSDAGIWIDYTSWKAGRHDPHHTLVFRGTTSRPLKQPKRRTGVLDARHTVDSAARGPSNRGLFSVTEQWMPKDSGAHTKHVHNVDEWFFVLDGTVDFELEGETSSGQDGDSLWIPRGTVHSFNVTSDVGHVLNGYTPGGFEQVIKGLARPAPKRELPPRTEEPSPEDIAAAQFLFSNYWTARAEDPWAKSFAR